MCHAHGALLLAMAGSSPVKLRLALAAALATACSSGSEPRPGSVALSLVSPNGPEGAVVLEAATDNVVSASVAGGTAVVRTAGGIARLVMVLDQPGAIEATLDVLDVGHPPAFSVVEVAAGDNTLRPSVDGYEVRVEPVGRD